jgi:hypothetical protein
MSFAEYYEQWSKTQPWVPGTLRANGLAAKSVTFANIELNRLRPSHLLGLRKSAQREGATGNRARQTFARYCATRRVGV